MTNNDKSMSVYKAILSRRSIRKFQQKEIPIEKLRKFVNAARLAPSAANLQPLEFFVVNKKELCDKVFTSLNWAGYITPKWKPDENQRPAAYIIPVVAEQDNKWYQRDVSFATENIILAAEEEDIGSCVICKIDKDKLRDALNIPNNIIIDSVIALGYKAEKSIVEDYVDTIKYWRDEEEVMHVPKRKLEDIIHINKF
jgi:nitroreductase